MIFLRKNRHLWVLSKVPKEERTAAFSHAAILERRAPHKRVPALRAAGAGDGVRRDKRACGNGRRGLLAAPLVFDATAVIS